jgi:hypothetical protein
MYLRFRRRIRLFPGLWLNLSENGISLSFGVRGATVNLSKEGTKGNLERHRDRPLSPNAAPPLVEVVLIGKVPVAAYHQLKS